MYRFKLVQQVTSSGRGKVSHHWINRPIKLGPENYPLVNCRSCLCHRPRLQPPPPTSSSSPRVTHRDSKRDHFLSRYSIMDRVRTLYGLVEALFKCSHRPVQYHSWSSRPPAGRGFEEKLSQLIYSTDTWTCPYANLYD